MKTAIKDIKYPDFDEPPQKEPIPPPPSPKKTPRKSVRK
jgi:hypothetical protein